MRKTICDRCGADCVNFTGRIWAVIEHTTRSGEEVGTDEHEPVDVGSCCWPAVSAYLGLRVRQNRGGPVPEDGPVRVDTESRELMGAHP